MAELFWATGFSAQAHTLQALSMEELLRRLRQGSDGLQAQVKMLRHALGTDPKLYQQRKRHLPFFIPAAFHEGICRGDRVEAAYGWVLDLDHCYQSQAQFDALKNQLWQDPRLWLLYVSPSGTGLKLLFRFAQPISHTKAFSDSYQAFARQFARQYQLDTVVDFKTHDLTRVSFFSYDPGALQRRDPLRIQPEQYLKISYPGAQPPSPPLPPADPLPWEDEPLPPAPDWRPKAAAEPLPESVPQVEPKPVPEASPSRESREPQGELWDQIRQTLKPQGRIRRRQVTLPDEIEALSPAIIQAGEGLGLQLKDTLDLNYGRKFIFRYQQLWAEVNVYFGKHGFSVVKSPKSGSDPKLREVIYELVQQLIFDPEGLDQLAKRVGSQPPWA
jgi:hypothetical protein